MSDSENSLNLSTDSKIELGESNDVYTYINKIFADQALLLKNIEQFLREEIRSKNLDIQNRLASIELRLEKIENSNFENLLTPIKNEIDLLQNQIKSIAESKTSLPVEERLMNLAHYNVDEETNINCDVLFLGDSSLKNLKPEIMDSKSKCQKKYLFYVDRSRHLS